MPQSRMELHVSTENSILSLGVYFFRLSGTHPERPIRTVPMKCTRIFRVNIMADNTLILFLVAELDDDDEDNQNTYDAESITAIVASST